MKILYIASTKSHIDNFHIKYINYFRDMAYKVDILPDNNIIFFKSMFSVKNFSTLIKIVRLINKEDYQFIICNTALASFFTRLAVFLSYKKPIVINIVHGYLFYKFNIKMLAEMIFKPNYTMVMNQFDYDFCKKYKLYKEKLFLIDGMGVDFEKLKPNECKNPFNENDFILIFAGEFSKRKNQEFLIRAMDNLQEDIKLILLGDGEYLDKLKNLANELNVADRISFLGYKKNIADYYNISDVCVSASTIEGLPFNIMEAMYMGLIIITNDAKGNIDLSEQCGLSYKTMDEFIANINKVYESKELQRSLKDKSKIVSDKYSINKVFNNIINIFKECGIEGLK